MNNQIVRLEFFKEQMKFSCAHFTIFDQSNKERLHGHNFFMKAIFYYDRSKMFINYQELKSILYELCEDLDEMMILPKNSPYLKIKEKNENIEVSFLNSFYSFPKTEVMLLPIENTTVEELSFYLKNQFEKKLKDKNISFHQTEIGISSGHGQFGFS